MLKQAPRACDKNLAGKIINAGWFHFDADPNLWLLKDSARGMIAALLCYVDAMQIVSKYAPLSDPGVAEIKPWWPCTVQAADRLVVLSST